MWTHSERTAVARALAGAALAGPWELGAVAGRLAAVVDVPPPWLGDLARELLAAHPRPPHDGPRELGAWVALRIAGLEVVEERDGRRVAVPPPATAAPHVVRPGLFAAAMARRPWPVPELATPGDLATLLGLGVGELAWWCDVRSLERSARDEPLRHYRYRFVPRRAGGPPRAIEAPKPRLKALQRRVLEELLLRIPPHEIAHGFVRGRSVRSHAAAHTGRRVVLRFDLEDFFATVPAGRVFATLRAAGYPESVAHHLTGLMTNAMAPGIWARAPRPTGGPALQAHARLGRRLRTPHLPQGAPTSPALANLAAHGLDRRLAGLAAALEATVTRYADDIVLSGGPGLLRRATAVRAAVGEIAREEGFVLHLGKARRMTDAGRQEVTGIVVNAHPGAARAERDRLRALLHEAERDGVQAANRAGIADLRAHVLGRIAWVTHLDAAQGARLHAQFARVDWPA